MKINTEVRFEVFEDEKWENCCAKLIAELIESICAKKGKCNIMVTGGRSAKNIYPILFQKVNKLSEYINIFFTDERCISSESSDSNYKLLIDSLPSNFNKNNIANINGVADNLEAECERYSKILPKHLDILLLSIGDDGHIASIFPNFSDNIFDDMVIQSNSINHNHNRISVSTKVFDTSLNTFCFVRGLKKGILLNSVFKEESSAKEYPAKLIKSSNWLLDKSASKNFIYK